MISRLPHLSVVVPVYNEIENLSRLHLEVMQALAQIPGHHELILVDDGSTDGSREFLRDLAQRDPRVKVVCFRRNFGQTAALQAGIDESTGEYLAMLDGDLQNDPADLPKMLQRLESGYDLVCGYRENRQDRWLTRRLPSQVANWLIRGVTRVPVRDLGCTLRVMRRELALDLELVGEMHRFIPILAHQKGARLCEVPTHHRPRQSGVSKYGFSRLVRVLLDLLTVKFLLDYFTSPMKFFGKLGLFSLLISGLAFGATAWMKWAHGVDVTGNPFFLASIFAGLASLQFVSLGVLGEMNVRLYFERNGRRPYGVAFRFGPGQAGDLSEAEYSRRWRRAS